MDTLEKAELAAFIRHIARFLKWKKKRFTISKSRIRLAEKREDEKESLRLIVL